MSCLYKHPDEDVCLNALIKNNIVRMLLAVYNQLRAETSDFAEIRNRNFRVTAQNWPKLYSLFRTAVSRLSIQESVTLYTEFSYSCSVNIVGTDDDAAIIISSACIEQMSDDELLALMGRALAHIQCHHLTYLKMNSLLDTLFPKIPFVGAAAAEVAKGLLLSWVRCAEMTADRGGAVASGSADYVVDAIMVQMGGRITKYPLDWVPEKTIFSPMNIEDGALFNTIVQRMTDQMNVPFGMLRIQDLIRWINSKACEERIPYLYYNSGYGKNLPNGQNAQEDFRNAICVKSTDRRMYALLIHRAARTGNMQAMVRVGRMYLGSNDALHVYYGVDCIRRSALANDPDGQYVLGILYEKGIPGYLPRNSQMAQWLIRLAYGEGQPNAVATVQKRKTSIPHVQDEHLRRVLKVTQSIVPELALQLHRQLWIPQQDSIICAEVLDAAEDEYEAIAICTTGIYSRMSGQPPAWIDWSTFSQSKREAHIYNNQIYVLIDGRKLWYGDKMDKLSIVYKIVVLSKIIT